MRPLMLGCLILTAGAASDGGARVRPVVEGAPPPSLEALDAEQQEPQQSEVAHGLVEMSPERTARIGAPLAGRVEEVAVRKGARVQRGERLVAVASPEFIALRLNAFVEAESPDQMLVATEE